MQISVIVPARNEEKSIADLLDGLLAQSFAADEIVINDGGSTDDTVSIIQKYIETGAPIRLIQSGPALPGRARNLAARNAGNEWLAFIDAGVRPEAGWLQNLQGALAEDKTIDVVYGSYEPVIDTLFKECAAIAYVPPPIEMSGTLIRPHSIVSALMRRSVWEEAGGFPENLRSAEDLLFMQRIEATGKRIAYAPRAVVHWQLQPGFWRTFKKFVAYSRSNIQAGLWRQWQAAILKRYTIIAVSGLPAFLLGWKWLLVTFGLWLTMLLARAVISIRRNRRNYPAGPVRNLIRLIVLVPLIALLDAAAIAGCIRWLLQDKLHLGNTPARISNGI